MKMFSAFALTAALSAAIPLSSALAETISLSAPLAGSSLRSGGIHMSTYFIPVAQDALEVVVTYADDATPYQPKRIVMALRDGDQARFGLPGHPGTLYTFSRDGGVVTISDRPGTGTLRTANEGQAATLR